MAELPTAEEEATARENLKASAKAKLIAGQPLTEEEADTIIFKMIETEQVVQKLDKEVAVIKNTLDRLENNHLAHIKKDIDRIMIILGAVGLVVLGELFVLLNAVL